MVYIKYKTVEKYNYVSYEISVFRYTFYDYSHQYALVATDEGLCDIGFFMTQEEYIEMENMIAECISNGDKLIDLTDRFAFTLTRNRHDMTDEDLKHALFCTLNAASSNDLKDNTFKENG